MAKTAKSYWIKERHNPQFEKPYYTACGQLSKTAARKSEDALYGHNIMLEYTSLEEYNKALEKLEAKGFTVHR